MDYDTGALGEAMDAGFRQDTAEKVARLLDLLRALEEAKQTRGLFTLKGGTSLNVFHLPDIPRLSVDIDLMVTGVPDASPGSTARARVIEAVPRVAKNQGYQVSANDSGTSGCTLYMRYRNGLGTRDQIKVDLDFLNRTSLTPPTRLSGPKMFDATDLAVANLSRAELLGSKLTAVAYRAHARDLYDMHRMLELGWAVLPRARKMYLGYSFLHDYQLYRLDYPIRLNVGYDGERLRDVLREAEGPPTLDEVREQATERLGKDPSYATLLDDEIELHGRLTERDAAAFGPFCGETDDARCQLLAEHPGLLWRFKHLKPTNS